MNPGLNNISVIFQREEHTCQIRDVKTGEPAKVIPLSISKLLTTKCFYWSGRDDDPIQSEERSMLPGFQSTKSGRTYQIYNLETSEDLASKPTLWNEATVFGQFPLEIREQIYHNLLVGDACKDVASRQPLPKSQPSIVKVNKDWYRTGRGIARSKAQKMFKSRIAKERRLKKSNDLLLRATSLSLLEAGFYKDAQTIIQKITAPKVKDWAFEDSAHLLAKLGDLRMAINFTQQIVRQDGRSGIFQNIFLITARNNNKAFLDEAVETIDALYSKKEITPSERSRFLYFYVQARMIGGDVEGAIELAKQIVHLDEWCYAESPKINAYEFIIDKLIQNGDIVKVVEIAIEVAKNDPIALEDKEIKDVILDRIAWLLIEAGITEEGRVVASLIQEQWTREAHYKKIRQIERGEYF